MARIDYLGLRLMGDSGVLSQGEAFGRIFRKVGMFKYHCRVHPSAMRGIITVG